MVLTRQEGVPKAFRERVPVLRLALKRKVPVTFLDGVPLAFKGSEVPKVLEPAVFFLAHPPLEMQEAGFWLKRFGLYSEQAAAHDDDSSSTVSLY